MTNSPDDPTPDRPAPDARSGPEAAASDPLAAGGADDDARDAPLLSRRSALLGALGLGAVALAGGGFAVGRLISPTPGPVVNTAAPLLTREPLKITHGGGICDGPLYAAAHKGFFEQHGVQVELIKSAAGEDTKDGLSSGKYAAGPGIFFSWLKPIEQGLNVKLTSGVHEGCLWLVVPTDSPLQAPADLLGKRIGVSAIGSSAMSFFSLDLLDAGIVSDPAAGQVQWLVFDNDILPDALTRGEVDAIAASDPIGLLPTLDGRARELSNNQTGPNAQHYCCAVAVNADIIRDQPEVARALTLGWADGSRWVGSHIEETAKLEVDNKYVAGTLDQVQAVLSTYGFNPSAVGLRKEIEPGIQKFEGTGYLDPGTDPKALADLVFADLGFNW